jgi:hypothetical protein
MKFPGRFQLVQLIFCFNYIFFVANINAQGELFVISIFNLVLFYLLRIILYFYNYCFY